MNVSSKTGLVPTPHKRVLKQKKVRPETLLSTNEVVKPISLSLRPFGGLYNPYAKGCSVLCNHPAPTAVRSFINQLKTSLATESKACHHKEPRHEHYGEADNIPEDLFRRYTDTDSRPLTPSPTVTSVRTRNSAGSFLNNRRCITPELRKNEISQRKKIILDLRRSHSQETLYWKPSSEVSQNAPADPEVEPKKSTSEKKVKKQKSDDVRPKTPAVIPEEIQEELKPPISCINERDISDEDARRGKKRKKLKPQPVTTTFHLSNDPETQVAALGPDSLNPSTRPSLIPNSGSLLPPKGKSETEPVLLSGSFLTDEALAALKIELDVDKIENTFGRYLNRAMREALKYVPIKPKEKKEQSPYETGKLYFETQTKMPRKLSKTASRFEVPLDINQLEKMTVFDYLSNYVWVSRQSKQLYKKVFLRHLVEEAEPDTMEDNEVIIKTEFVERKMSAKSLYKALDEVLEFYGTDAHIKEILRIINVDEDLLFNFRSWCGIVAFGERLALDAATATDSCDELEKADFASMRQRLERYKVPENLMEVFNIIQSKHKE